MTWFNLNYLWFGLGAIALVILIKELLGLVIITDQEVGIINKKFSSKSLVNGIIALNGEAGIQADTLKPGWHFFYFRWQYEIIKSEIVQVPAGQIALINAKDGVDIPTNRMLGKRVDCDNYQDARKFLTSGGEKGRQTGILTAGSYRVNKELFEVVTAVNCRNFGLQPNDLNVFNIPTDTIGIVTTLDGAPIRKGEIAGKEITGHQNFQNIQAFIENGGERGLQEQVLLSGSWNLNPWFVKIELDPVTIIDIGTVGVVISYVGEEHEDVSGAEFTHGDLVRLGHKGVWVDPLNPGKHAINTRTMKVVHVPTTNIALNWSNKSEDHGLDERLESLNIRSKDGFSFSLDIAQIIHVGSKNAPKVIARFGNMEKLINQVLEPAIDNYFRNSAQNSTILDFLGTRVARQDDALEFIKSALGGYNIEAVGTYIGFVKPPEELMKTQTERKLAEENEITYKTRENAQKALQSLQKEEALAALQQDIVAAEQEVNIEKSKANAAIEKAKGEAESTRIRAEVDAKSIEVKGAAEATSVEAIGLAKAKVYEASVKAMGADVYGKIQVINTIAEKNLKVTPDTLIMGGNGGNGSSDVSPLMIQTLVAQALTGKEMFAKAKEVVVEA